MTVLRRQTSRKTHRATEQVKTGDDDRGIHRASLGKRQKTRTGRDTEISNIKTVRIGARGRDEGSSQAGPRNIKLDKAKTRALALKEVLRYRPLVVPTGVAAVTTHPLTPGSNG